MSALNRDVVRASFAGQAAAFEDPARSFGRADVAAWMVANSPTEPTDIVLEVAAGTGLFGRALAPHVALVVAVDITSEMLAEGKRAAQSTGVSNIVFEIGDATHLPFDDASFDRVISRLAIHHFEDPGEVLSEMQRVCRPGGSLIIIDIVVLEAADAAVFNDLERRRDPAHTVALTRQELHDAVRRVGLRATHTSEWENVLDGDSWLQQTSTPAEQAAVIRAAWEMELAGGPRTGMAPRRRQDGRVEFVHVWELIVAEQAYAP